MSRRVSLAWLGGVSALVGGCNLVSGVGSLEVGPDDAASLDSRDSAAEGDAVSTIRDAAADEVGVADSSASDARDANANTDAPDASNGPFVFITSTLQNGRFNGVTSGDDICTTLARATLLPGVWVAWLSANGGPDAVDRMTGAGPWYLRSGELVASGRAQLLSGALAHGIDRTEKNVLVAPTDGAWTGTGTNGRFDSNACANWGGGSQGNVGRAGASNAAWTAAAVDGCDAMNRIYCFQQ